MGIFRRLILFVLALVLLVAIPLSIFGLWTKTTLLDTDHYVETISPLASDNAVQTQVTVSIMSYLDGLAADASDSTNASAQLVASEYTTRRATIEEAVASLLNSDAFRTIWEGINREAHGTLVDLLEGNVTTDEQGRVTLNLAPVYESVQQELMANGITVLARVNPSPESMTMPLFQYDDITEYREYVDIFDKVTWIIPIVTLVLVLLYLWWSPKKFRGIFWLALITAIGMGVLFLLIMVGRDATAGTVTDGSERDAALAIYDEVTRSLDSRLKLIGIASLVVAALALIAHRTTKPSRF